MSSYKPKIVMVGGGSYGWSPCLISDLIQTPELEGSDVILLDINLAAAKEIKAVADRLCADNHKKFRFTATSNEDNAFKDADFVVITISTGGLDMMKHDLEIPEHYGIYQSGGDSVGPGGWSRLLRNVPVFEKMARKIERLSPHAVVLNYTNPMAGLTGVIAQTTSLRTVGLCHGIFSTYWLIRRIFQCEEKDISVRFGGVNHFFWLLDFKVNGRDGYTWLHRKLAGASIDEYLDKTPDGKNIGKRGMDHILLNEMLKEYGYLTYLDDRHTCEYFSTYLTDPKMIKRYRIHRTTIGERKTGLRNARKKALDMASGKEPILPRSRETAIDMITAFVTNKPFVDVVNLPNIGQIENLPLGAVVETMGQVNSMGFMPIAIGPMPEILRGLTDVHCRVQKMALEAALTGDRKLAMEALMLDPLCAKLAPSDVRKMGLELLHATREYLPQF